VPKYSTNRNNSVVNLFEKKRLIILSATKATFMKKILALIVLAAFVSACSQYTCPTYSKKDVKKTVVEKKI
jgi:peroxiredoxin